MSGNVLILHDLRCAAAKRPGLSKALCVGLALMLSLQVCGDAFATHPVDVGPSELTNPASAQSSTRPRHDHGQRVLAMFCFGESTEHQHPLAIYDSERPPPFPALIALIAHPQPRRFASFSSAQKWQLASQRAIPPVYLTTLRLRF